MQNSPAGAKVIARSLADRRPERQPWPSRARGAAVGPPPGAAGRPGTAPRRLLRKHGEAERVARTGPKTSGSRATTSLACSPAGISSETVPAPVTSGRWCKRPSPSLRAGRAPKEPNGPVPACLAIEPAGAPWPRSRGADREGSGGTTRSTSTPLSASWRSRARPASVGPPTSSKMSRSFGQRQALGQRIGHRQEMPKRHDELLVGAELFSSAWASATRAG